MVVDIAAVDTLVVKAEDTSSPDLAVSLAPSPAISLAVWAVRSTTSISAVVVEPEKQVTSTHQAPLLHLTNPLTLLSRPNGIRSNHTSRPTRVRDTSRPQSTAIRHRPADMDGIKDIILAVTVRSRATLFLQRISKVMRTMVVRDLEDTGRLLEVMNSLRRRSHLLAVTRMIRTHLLVVVGGSGAVVVVMRRGRLVSVYERGFGWMV